MKETLGIIIRMQHTGGWRCVLAFQSYSPSEIAIPSVLSPSKNPSLKDIPSLEADLMAVERLSVNHRLFAKDGNISGGSCWMFPKGGENAILTQNNTLLQPTSDSKLTDHPALGMSEATSNGHIVSVIPDTTKQTAQPFDIWQNWGSELELATPKAAPSRAPLADFGSERPELSTLDLNADPMEHSAKEDEPDCSLLLSTGLPPEIQLETPSLSLQQSSVTDETAEQSGLESFADSLSSYKKNMGLFPTNGLVKLNVMQCPQSLRGEDSGGCLESVINLPSADRCTNASTTSSPIYFSHEENPYGGINSHFIGCPLTTSRNVCSIEHHQYDIRGYRKQVILRRWGRNTEAFKSKARAIRPGSTSERITEITLQELSQYFSMPITQAAMKLNVGLTVLKKRCREFQIPRWPHRKMKSINSLIGNIKDLAEEQGVKASPRVLNVVKELEEQRKLMEEMPGVELAERTKKLRQACFKANYKKRRLGMMGSSSNLHLMRGYVPGQLAPLDLNPTFVDSPSRSSLTVDHFL